MPVIEVFADIWCPFAYVGLEHLVQRRAAVGRAGVPLLVRAWPLELVNGSALDADAVAEEVEALRRRVAPGLFGGFDPHAFPTTTLPALDLAAAAYRHGPDVGEAVSLALRRALFEHGRRVEDPDVLAEIAEEAGVGRPGPRARDLVLADREEGRRRGVVGSPHFFVDGESFFCPTLEIRHVDGTLEVSIDPARFEQFADRCFAPAA